MQAPTGVSASRFLRLVCDRRLALKSRVWMTLVIMTLAHLSVVGTMKIIGASRILPPERFECWA